MPVVDGFATLLARRDDAAHGFKHAHIAQPGFDTLRVDTKLEAMPDQPRGDAVEDALDADRAVLGDPGFGFFVLAGSADGQRFEGRAFFHCLRRYPSIQARHHVGDEAPVVGRFVEVPMTTQQERLIDGVLEAALTRFDGAILVGFAEVVAAGSQTIVFAQVGVAPRQFFLFGQVVEGGREAVGPMPSGTPPSAHRAFCMPWASAAKLSPPRTTSA